MKIIASLAAVAAMAFASAAVAGPLEGLYTQGTLGITHQDSRDHGVAYSVAVGKDFGAVRAEVEYAGTRGNDNSKLGNLSTDVLGVNAYYEPVTIAGITPYIGGGVGYGQLSRDAVVGNRNGAIFNGTVGASYNVTETLAVVGQYRYNFADDIKVREGLGKNQTENYRASIFSVGLRYTF